MHTMHKRLREIFHLFVLVFAGCGCGVFAGATRLSHFSVVQTGLSAAGSGISRLAWSLPKAVP